MPEARLPTPTTTVGAHGADFAGEPAEAVLEEAQDILLGVGGGKVDVVGEELGDLVQHIRDALPDACPAADQVGHLGNEIVARIDQNARDGQEHQHHKQHGPEVPAAHPLGEFLHQRGQKRGRYKGQQKREKEAQQRRDDQPQAEQDGDN